MTKVAELLKQESEALSFFAENQLQKEAAVNSLVEEGIDQWTAAKLVTDYMEKSAETNAKILDNEDILRLKDVLEKAASYISELEEKNSELNAKIETSPEEIIKQAETHKKLTSILNEEEINALKDVPNDLIEKLANAASSVEPWEMGKAVGIPREKTDPFLEFLLG